MKKTRGKKPEVISEQVRAAIASSGVSRYRIAKDIDISESMLSLFMSGKRMLSLQALDVLGEYLGLELTTKRKL